ncbi:MAG: hypothetical protein DCF32_15295 [Leptolyngbya sp.]|nr:MAG: hypothetical protein DCF32_15295 [Leptolyngbya sp.]
MGNYFRAPGAKVRYTGWETRNYVSRKARVSRGFHLSPTRRVRLASPEGNRTGDGWRLWFFSPRGPAADKGNWRVDVVRADGGGGGGGDGGGGGLPACPPAGTTLNYLWVGWHYLDFNFTLPPPYYTTGSGSGQMPESVAASISPPNTYLFEDSYSDGPFTYAPWYWTNDDGDMGWLGETVFYSSTDPNPNLAALWNEWKADDRYVTPGFVLTQVAGDGFLAENPNGLPTPYCDDGSSPLPDPGGGTVPPGFLMGEGPWAYACSCPDFTGEEEPYKVATAPSHRRARSWGQIRPLSPCKHIVSSARALGDQKTLLNWVRSYRTDSPGTEFTTSPTIGVDRNYYKAQREMDAAFRRTTRLNRQAVNKIRRAERSRAALMRNLGTFFCLDAYGAYQGKRDNYGVPLNFEALDNRWDLYRETSPEQLMQGYSNTDTARRMAAYDREQRRSDLQDLVSAPRQPLIAPTASQRAADPRFWSASDVGYQIRYEVEGLIRPNRVRTAATLMVGGTGPAGTRRNNRSIQIPNPNPSPGAPRYVTIPGTRANSRFYGVSLR